MKDDYLKIVLLLLMVVVTIQGYFLYDMNRTLHGKQVSMKAEEPSVDSSIVPPMDFFDTKENPFIEMERLRRDMENRFMNFEDFFQAVPSLSQFSSKLYRTPSFDMKEQGGKYIITLEVPGLDKDAINIKTEHGRLIVSADVSKEADNNSTTYFQHERRASSYRHIVLLPTDADEKSLHSEYKDGLLNITFEKKVP